MGRKKTTQSSLLGLDEILDNSYSGQYIKILNLYSKNLESTNRSNRVLKYIFFGITMGVLGVLVGIFIFVIMKAPSFFKLALQSESMQMEGVIGAIVSIIASLTSLIVGLIKLPQIIAEYLFNPNEDVNMGMIIKSIQNYEIQRKYQDAEAMLAEKKSGTGKPLEKDKELLDFKFEMPRHAEDK